MPDGAAIASGRDADIYALEPGLILRRYRSDHDTIGEAAVMQHVAQHGYPAPGVVWVRGREMVMERIDGPTMLSDLERRPWRLRRHTDTLARLIQQLHTIPAPGWLRRRHPTGDAIVHLDLHPANVMLTPRGPIVIDWGNAGLGDPATEVADLWLILATADIPSPQPLRTVLRAARSSLVRRLLGHFGTEEIRGRLPDALAGRLQDPNMGDAELERMRALVERERR